MTDITVTTPRRRAGRGQSEFCLNPVDRFPESLQSCNYKEIAENPSVSRFLSAIFALASGTMPAAFATEVLVSSTSIGCPASGPLGPPKLLNYRI